MKKLVAAVVMAMLAAVPVAGAADELAVALPASWVLDAPIAGEHAVAVVRALTTQLDLGDFAPGEWRQYQIGISGVKVKIGLLHRYDAAPSDFPVPEANVEEWSIELGDESVAATIEWTTLAGDRSKLNRVYTRDDRIDVMPRMASTDAHVGVAAALQHARLDAVHAHASLAGVLRGGYPVWRSVDGGAFDVGDTPELRLPRLLIIASGYNSYRSKLGRDALQGPACIGWQNCGEQRGVRSAR